MSGYVYRLSRRIFVSNLPWTIGQKELYDYFSAFGPLVSHNVVFDKTSGLSKKFGFVQFGNEDGYREVLKQKTHFLEGNYLRLEDGDQGERTGREPLTDANKSNQVLSNFPKLQLNE